MLELDPTTAELAVLPLVVLIVEGVKRLAAGGPKWLLPAAALVLALAGQGLAAGLVGEDVDPRLGVALWLAAVGLYESMKQGGRAARGRSRLIEPRE